MKKFYAFLTAALMSVSLFASVDVVPTDAVLADYYDQGNVCVCFFVPADMACNDIVLTGSFNGWSSNAASCVAVEAVEGYDGWYVGSFAPEAVIDAEKGIQVKPVMLDVDGNFNWEYQAGAATIIRGGVQLVQGAYAGEIDLINYGTDAPNVLAVDAWKQNPCTAIYHNYTITVISDGCDDYVLPYLVGTMTGWTFQQMQLDYDATIANGAPTYYATFKAAEGSMYQIVSGKLAVNGAIEEEPTWTDNAYIQKLVNDVWVRIPGEDGDNALTHEEANIVYDLRDADLRWARCVAQDQNTYTVHVTIPACGAEVPVLVGSFNNWDLDTAIPMIYVSGYTYSCTVQALSTDLFKIAGAINGWYNQIWVYSSEDDAWEAAPNMVFGDQTDINVDFSNSDYYKWSHCEGTQDSPFDSWFGDNNWQSETVSYLEYDAATGKATVHINQNKDAQWKAQVKYHGIAAEEGKFYHLGLKMKANHNISGVTIKWQDDNNDPSLIFENQSIVLSANTEYVYDNTHIAGIPGNGILMLDFGYAKSGDIIEIYDIVIEEDTSSVGESNPMTINLQVPINVSNPNIFVWDDNLNPLLGEWPGTPMTAQGSRLYAYSFDPYRSSVNVIFNYYDENEDDYVQTANINNVTGSACYRIDGTMNSGMLNCAQIDCSEEPIDDPDLLPYFDFEKDGFYYKIASLTDLTVELTANYYYMNSQSEALVGGGCYSGDIVVPSSVTWNNRVFTVSAISIGAFSYCTLHTLTIPESVISASISGTIDSLIIQDSDVPLAELSVSGAEKAYVGRNVSEYWSYAFAYSSIKKVIFGNKVTYISREEFGECRYLNSVTIPSSVIEIYNSAFRDCSSLTTISGESVERIGTHAFTNCIALTSINFPRLEYIENGDSQWGTYRWGVFQGCTSLTEVVLPKGLTSVGTMAFMDCSSLTTISIPASLVNIGDSYYTDRSSVFANCPLTSITNYSLQPQSISESTFDTQTYFNATLHVPAQSVQAYQSTAPWSNFFNVVGDVIVEDSETDQQLLKYRITGENPRTAAVIGHRITEPINLIIPDSIAIEGNNYAVTAIERGALANSVILSVVIPNTVNSIEESVFNGCANLTELELPASVRNIGSGALYCGGSYDDDNLGNLHKVIIHSTHIERNYIDGESTGIMENTNLDTIIAPASVFGDQLFYVYGEYYLTATNLKYLQITGDELSDMYSQLKYIHLSEKTLKTFDAANATNTTIPDQAFSGFYNLTSLTLPANLESISYMAVAGCKSLTSIDIPASVQTIEPSAFEDCRSLTTVTFGGQPGNEANVALETIGNWAFYNCHALTNISIPAGVTEIGEGAFYDCTYLENVSMPASMQSLGDHAFALCQRMNRMKVEAVLPPMANARTFDGVNRNIPVYVPDASLNLYQNAEYWREFFICPISEIETGIDNTWSDGTHTTKILRDGQILILRGDKVYTLQGQELK